MQYEKLPSAMTIRFFTPRCQSRRMLLCVLCIFCLSGCGCRRDPVPVDEPTRNRVESTDQDHLEVATSYLASLNSLGRQQASHQVLYHLNLWTEKHDSRAEWKPDPLLDDLPEHLLPPDYMMTLDRPRFAPSDMMYFEEMMWSQQITRWAVSIERPEWMESILVEQQATLKPLDADKLHIAERLFDWVVRHIQLDAPLPPNTESDPETAGPNRGETEQDETKKNDTQSDAEKGIAGPGYTRRSWWTLLFGHGDAQQRARVFAELARQRDIDVVILAVRANGKDTALRFWLSAALIGDELYLFDTQLGVPLLKADASGILTLRELRASPESLEQLALDAETPYSVDKDDLKHVVALVPADPLALTWRMQQIESGLPDERRMSVAVYPSDTKQHLEKAKQVDDVRLWDIPWKVLQYERAVFSPQSKNIEAARAHAAETQPFDPRLPLRKAARHICAESWKPRILNKALKRSTWKRWYLIVW